MSRVDTSFTAIADLAGGATITINPSAQEWLVAQVSTECNASPVGARCFVRKNGNIISKMIPAGDVASGDPPVLLRPGDNLTVVWTGVSAAATCKATLIYDDGV